MCRRIICIALVCLFAALAACTRQRVPAGFVTVHDGRFEIDGRPYKYIGTNFWYGPILASEGRGGNRPRLHRELDRLQQAGIGNLRILVGGDGDEGIPSHIEPVLQLAPGIYNDTLLRGLDYLLCELERRGMKAVLYFNNAWEWSGGYGTYLQWAGRGVAPVPNRDGWPAYMQFVEEFVRCDSAKQLALEHVRTIVSRTNSLTGKPYAASPAIMAWQIANEPRAFSDANKPLFAAWIAETARCIKALDPHHLVTTGSEGRHGCEQDLDLWRTIHALPDIDYATIHIWPYNWGWVTPETLVDRADSAAVHALAYVDLHADAIRPLGKPLVLEEFGYPRDGFRFGPGTPTCGRDRFYEAIFAAVRDGESLAGCNFWGWGGEAVPAHTFWERWDDYLGDPAQEEQGLNTVFATDSSTLRLIRTVTDGLCTVLKQKQ